VGGSLTARLGDALVLACPGGGSGSDDAAFDRAFDEDSGEDAACATATLKVGAVVHKARVQRTGSGPVLVSIKLVGTKK
jgi:hypothetical protein